MTCTDITFFMAQATNRSVKMRDVGCGYVFTTMMTDQRSASTTIRSMKRPCRCSVSMSGRGRKDQGMSSEKSSEKVIYKCGQCKWLNGEKSSVGIACTNPDRVWRTVTSKYHYKHTKACKMFNADPMPKRHDKIITEIPMKLPSLNDYVNACRANRFQGSKMKKTLEMRIGYYLRNLPTYERPIKIHFHWIEGSKRRDLDNIAFAKKFILDAMVKENKLKDDNRKCVTAFTDTFAYGNETKVILTIEEV